MSFLFGGRKEPSSEEKFAMIETELETSIDTFQRYCSSQTRSPYPRKHAANHSPPYRMVDSCNKKCVMSSSQNFVEGELNKGESVCVDRCVSKYVQAMEKMSKMMQEKQQEQMGGAGGGMFGP